MVTPDDPNLTLSRVMPLVYDELRRIARRCLAGEKGGRSLQPTALVHEAYLKLAGEKHRPWKNNAHFRAIAASSMREILVDRARARGAAKRGGSRVRVTLTDAVAASGPPLDLLALDQALTRLGAFGPQTGPDRGAALLRRPHGGGMRAITRCFSSHREARMVDGPGLAQGRDEA